MRLLSTAHGPTDSYDDVEVIELPAVNTPPELVASGSHARLPSIKPLRQQDQSPGSFDANPMILVRSLAANGFASSQVTSDSDLMDEHVHIAAHLYGWDSIRERFPDPSFERLAAIDQVLIPFKDYASRLAILLLQKIWKAGLPSEHIFHCFPWPGIREVVCRKAYEYEVNDIWFTDYMAHWRLAWPFDIEDSIETSPITGMLQFTPRFRACFLDIRNWTFESDFFEAYPDFQGTANKFEPQLAVVRLHHRTAAHELTMQRASKHQEVRRLLQEYYDRMSRLRTLVNNNET